jgi:prepilin-type N-terminal cleavage/methylation domain-containing protein/prepilin-type processing-associated H-X9-DG protein
MPLKPKAFTLIELLVVTSIISLMAAGLLPVLSRAKLRAYRICCLNCLRQQGIALRNYADDSGYYVPYGPYDERVVNRNDFWDVRLQPYLANNKSVVHCPSLKLQAFDGVTDPIYKSITFPVNDRINWSSTGLTSATPNLSYGYNASGAKKYIVGVYPHFGLDGAKESGAKECSVAFPSEMISITDYNPYTDDDGDGNWHPYAVYNLTLSGRHNQGANTLFCDCHADYYKTNVLHQNQPWWNTDHGSH